ncbi:hypothetical protein [Arhodomonas aquaeolei]|uniref:hypothetical protein n=1 Tax=Arhodomonas aquaeolei TaxID=2369 RepID=UPI000368ABD6|nr:hypothetical protein [Arhodomonas aquaeolei]
MSDASATQAASSRLRWLGAILWPSFLTAGVATMVFFANVDPETLRYETLPDWEIGRKLGYTLGFFMFWAVCAASSALSVWLFSPARRAAKAGRKES